MLLSLPNIISWLRVAISPIFFLMIISEDPDYIITACILFGIGALTDYLDGWLARKYSVVSSWGRFLDPLADKFLTTAAFLSFVSLEIIPLWMVIIIIIRDFITTVMRVIADRHGYIMQTSVIAKWKTLFQMVFIIYILLLLLLSNSSNEIISEIMAIFTTAEEIKELLYSGLTYAMMLLLTLLTFSTLMHYIYVNKLMFIRALSGKNG